MYSGQSWPFLKSCEFSSITYFLEPFFVQNNSNVIAESFFARFWEFLFWIQSDHFAKTIPHV